MYNQYMASAPPLSLDNDTAKLNGISKRIDISPTNRFISQDSTETNTSDDIRPSVIKGDKEIFTVENQMSKMDRSVLPDNRHSTIISPVAKSNSTEGSKTEKTVTSINRNSPTSSIAKSNSTQGFSNEKLVLQANQSPSKLIENISLTNNVESNSAEVCRNDLPNVLRSRRNILEPIKRGDPSVPSWSLAKGPCVVGMQRKSKSVDNDGKSLLYDELNMLLNCQFSSMQVTS